jgi:phosphatidylglycerol:prolipoprotein diacylglycerol transferase
VHPIAFKIGSFPIYFYGLMMVVAYVVTLLTVRYTKKFEDLDTETAVDVTIYAILGGVLGARVLYVLLNFHEYLASPLQIFNVREGGLSWHGAMIGGLIGTLILAKIKKMPLGKITDYASVHTTLGLAIGRIGCFLNGCCYGKPSNLPWAVEFTGTRIPFHRHPTQLYESILMIITFFFCLYWWRKKKFHGEMTCILFLSYGIVRFIVEFFRENTPNQYLFNIPISQAQYFSIVLIIICSIIIYIKRKNSSEQEMTDYSEKESLQM